MPLPVSRRAVYILSAIRETQNLPPVALPTGSRLWLRGRHRTANVLALALFQERQAGRSDNHHRWKAVIWVVGEIGIFATTIAPLAPTRVPFLNTWTEASLSIEQTSGEGCSTSVP